MCCFAVILAFRCGYRLLFITSVHISLSGTLKLLFPVFHNKYFSILI